MNSHRSKNLKKPDPHLSLNTDHYSFIIQPDTYYTIISFFWEIVRVLDCITKIQTIQIRATGSWYDSIKQGAINVMSSLVGCICHLTKNRREQGLSLLNAQNQYQRDPLSCNFPKDHGIYVWIFPSRVRR